MTGKGHTSTGVVFGFFVITVLAPVVDVTLMALGYISCVLFASSPDWLEIQRKIKLEGGGVAVSTVIPHRTITHVISVWLLISTIGFLSLYPDFKPSWLHWLPSTGSFVSTLCIGCGFGGLIHLLWDIPNKKPVPMLTLWDKIGLNLWKSGRFEPQIIVATSLLTCTLIYFFLVKVVKLKLF